MRHRVYFSVFYKRKEKNYGLQVIKKNFKAVSSEVVEMNFGSKFKLGSSQPAVLKSPKSSKKIGDR